MGWNPFKSKKVTTVSTSVSRVISDDLIPNSMKTGVIKGIFEGGQLVEHILEDMTSSVGIRAERMYKFGKTRYVHGLPSSTLLCNLSGEDIVRATLEDLVGEPVTIEYYRYGPLNNLHYGWQTLVDSYGYNPYSNVLGNLSTSLGSTVYLTDIQVVVTNTTVSEMVNGSLDQWGTPATVGFTPLRRAQTSTLGRQRKPTPYAVDPASGQDYFLVSYVWVEHMTTMVNEVPITVDTIRQDSFTFNMSTLDADLGYFQAKYSYGIESNPTIKYWAYDDGAGTYPLLDKVFTTEFHALGSFFPLGYLRYNKQSTASDKTSTEYKSSKKLMEYLGIGLSDLSDAIDENPDIEDIESALLMMAVPAASTNPIELRYLFDFFKEMYLGTGGKGLKASEASTVISGAIYNNTSTHIAPQVSLVIQDKRFKLALNVEGIYRERKVGKLGAVGTYSMTQVTYTETATRTVFSTGPYDVTHEETYTITKPCHAYRHQIMENMYEEIRVYELTQSYFVWGSYVATGDEKQKNLLIPLDRAITEKYSTMDREELYSRSLHYVFNARIITKVKWYQQEWFSIFIIVIAIVITILTMGGASAAMAAMVSAVTAATVSVTALLITLLKYLIFTTVMKLFVKAVGPEAAMVLAVIAAAYGVYSQFTAVQGVAGAPWAAEMLKVSSGLVSSIGDYFSDALLALRDDADKFQLYATEQIKLLEDTNKLLAGNTLLSPFTLFGESPDDYYNRTVHTSNIGTLGFDAVTDYVGNALALPKLYETIQVTPGDIS